ncbi:amidohydrolase [Novosphingobium sp. G106]|uniref:amidohydrolase family protein n=1 Tax=Novosphingobium sp. G106 TaxID=2849500 RepID=UPI001C2DDDF1|nr:amidohydrolase family protein [Novosphingobium sp. G106]MBV1688707.1 amidohydrolase [Novosphingobium sp. G106]
MSEADPKFGSALKEDWTLGPIFDADAHIDPPYDMWKEYLPNHLKPRAPVIEARDDADYIVFEGNSRPVMMINNQAGRTGKDFKMKGRLSEQRNTYDPQKRLADMDLDGIDQAILFGGGPLGTFDNELYLASFEAFSNWVMDWASNAPHRLFPVGHSPMRDIDETIEHVKRLAKMGFKMVQLPAFPQNPDAWKTTSEIKNMKSGQVSAQTGDPKGALQYYQPEFDRLWKVLSDLGMVITFHLGGRVPRFGEKQHFLPDMPMSKLAMAEPIGIFIFNGIFDRFPDLRIGSMESGVGWFSWYAEYCDRTWEKQRYWTESVIDKLPSYFMDQNVWGSFIQDRAGILLRDLPGGKNIMWSSDYPHSETTFPNSHAIIKRDFAGVPDKDIQDIVCNNAKRLLRLS